MAWHELDRGVFAKEMPPFTDTHVNRDINIARKWL